MGYKKILTWFLISLLISQEVFRIPYSLSAAKALEIDSHENIVSLLVEEELFKKIQSDVEKYAMRVQSVLPRTRTVILTFSEKTHPVLIASANERLYYSGLPNHGNKTQKLIGTILIGNIPLPTVHKESTSFLSIFPYIDFDEPHFFWNWDKNVYEYLNVERKNPRPELWHSVIAPHTGDVNKDAEKTKDFFARVYQYDKKEGDYADLGKDPQVFYADSVRDSRATSSGSLAAYEKLFVPNQEHFIYNRYTKDLAKYLYENYLMLMKGKGINAISSFSNWHETTTSNTQKSFSTLDSIDETSLGSSLFLNTASDISTRIFARELVPEFVKTLSEKYIGDISRWIHQTGRYYDGYSKVRADTMPELIQNRDNISSQILREANDSFEKIVNNYIEGSLSIDIPVLVSRQESSRGQSFTYTNYFLGKKASNIMDASECSLLRGSSFGNRNSVAEMNHGYHVQGIKEDTALITKDGGDHIICNDKVTSYWGGNSPMNLNLDTGAYTLKNHKYDDFSQSVYDPAGGKKTTGQSSPFDCLKTDLLLEPYVRRVFIWRGYKEYKWPKETSGTRYSCATNFNAQTEYFGLNPSPETTENIFRTLSSCQGTGNVTLLGRNGDISTKCSSTGVGGTYKLTSSLIKHVSPDTATYGKQLKSLATPNLPVDETRHVVYVDRALQEKRFDYPNVFDIKIPIDATDDVIRKKIQEYLTAFDEKLQSEKNTSDLGVFQNLIPNIGTKNDISLAKLVASSRDLEDNLVASLRWKGLPTAMKYQQGIVDGLRGDKSEKVGMFGDSNKKYEIAYMGGQGDAKNFIIGYHPSIYGEYPEWYQSIVDVQSSYEEKNKNEATQNSSQSESDPFTLSAEEYDEILGTDADSSSSGSQSDSGSCNYGNAVVIWEWLSAIKCWLSELFDTEWEPGESDYSFDWDPYLTLTLGSHTLYTTSRETVSISQSDTNSNNVTDVVENDTDLFSLRNSPSDYILTPKGSITITTSLEKGSLLINDNVSKVSLVILRIANLDTGVKYTPSHPDWEKVKKESFSVAGSAILRGGQATWQIRSLTSTRMSVEFETRIESSGVIYVRSGKTTLSPESSFPKFTLLSSDGALTPKTVRADDTQGVTILFQSENTPPTVDVEITEYTTNKIVLPRSSFIINQKTLKIGTPTIDPILHKAGKYIITLTSNGVSNKTDLFVVAGAPQKIITDIPKILLAKEKYTVRLSVTDKWGNKLNTDSWTGILRSSQPIIFSDTPQPVQEFTFPLTREIQFQALKEGTLSFDITAQHNQESVSHSVTVSVLEDVQVDANIQHTEAIKVGQKLPVEFVIRTKQGTLVRDWDMPIRIGTKGTGAYLENAVVSFSAGKGNATLLTGTQSGKTSFYFSDTLSGKKIGNDFEIAPDVPNRLTFSGPETMLARRGQSQVLSVNIFDKYGNYIHPATVDIRVEGDREDLLESLGKVGNISGDTYGVHLVSRGYPGRVLIRGALWENGRKSTKIALENVWEVQILPVITSEDVIKNTWNALTHVLLGGPFGQFVTAEYFAGSLLFSPDTQALSVSTLVDNPRSGLFSIASSGALNVMGTPHLGTGLQVDWRPDSVGAFALLVSDKRLGKVSKVTYPRLTDSDKIVFSSSTSDVTVSSGTILYKGIPVTAVRNIFDTPVFSFVFIPSASDVRFNVVYNKNSIGTVTLAYSPRAPSTSGVNPSTFSLEMLMSDMVTDTIWGSLSSSDIRGVMVRESFAKASSVGGPVEDGYSAYPEKYGMGWTGDNLGLLQFASGESWSETQQAFADYVTINLGDALVQLPEYKVDTTTGFDSTIGTPVFIGSGEIDNFDLRDANNDQQKDIIVSDTDKSISVSLAKKDGTYLEMGEFLSHENARDGTIRTGDFFADGYVDSVYVDQGGLLRLVSHDAFSSKEIEIISDRKQDIGQITQVEVFDMDHDAHDDIVILDTLGQLSIFYGSSNKKFVYQFVDHVFDFSFADKSLFSGAISYEYPGFTFPDFTKTQNITLRIQQEQLQSVLYTSVALPNSVNTTPQAATTASLGTQIATSFPIDTNAGSGNALANISTEYDNLAQQYGSSFQLNQNNVSSKTISLLKAPFVDTSVLSISKKYTSLENDGTIVAGSNIQGVISLKNVSSKSLSKIVVAENFPSYLVMPIDTYTLRQGGKSSERKFVDYSEGGVADLRDITLAPGETIEIIYTAKFSAFSFGTFDVGYLEDKNDPLMNIDVSKEKILTINPEAQKLDTIPEKDFYNAEKYGDIRINPNNTCGGPLFLWRSHNTFDRTYQKTLIVRNIQDPEEVSMDISNDPVESSSDTSSSSVSSSQSVISALSNDSSSQSIERIGEEYASTAQSEFDTYNQDSDGDEIPDRYDEDTGDMFTLDTSGNTSQITITLGKLDDAIDEVIEGVESFISGLSCGFGKPGCIAQPMNWTANVPGNTITVLGYAVKQLNIAPIACYKDVRCGIPIFSVPTASTPYYWPPNPDEAGGAFDIDAGGGGGGSLGFTGGHGTSQFRIFIGFTLTAAIAEVLCFGPNNVANPSINFPGLFPISFQGNCIFATQPLTQCSDDGSDDIVVELETGEVEAEEGEEEGEGDVQLTDGDSCGFFTPVTSYPISLIQAVTAYINNPNSENLELLRKQISENASLVTGSYSSDQSLQFATSSPYENIEETTSNEVISYPDSGSGIIKVTLDTSSFSGSGFGPIFDIQLKSITAFPKFIMDWYHRQLDEIVASLGALPDIKIFLPDLGSGFSDAGWKSQFNTSTTSSTTSSSSPSSVGNEIVSGIQGGIGGIQAAFEYLSLLPMVDVHPQLISLNLPWMDRSALQSWIYRNEAILAEWEALPQHALANGVNASSLISSIRSNIETVRTYMTLPEQLQNLFYLKEKFLYEILKNVHAIQQLMGGWLADNGERFKTWVETFILITKLWDLWQILIDIFDDYEESCAVCHNEQWNLQEWLWIIISAVIPPIPVIKMQLWPDIELDFSDIDLGIDIAYPVFNLSFYPLELPDMPSPNFSGITLPTVPQLPPLPDLNLDFEVPMIDLPKLPNLPPAPKIPELSHAISIVLKIFKIVTLIQCLYRKVPLSPEWYVGTKIAHKTDRQGYLPIDFLNVSIPSLVVKWIDAIRVSTHVELTYDVNYIIDIIQSALEPLSDFPRDLSGYTGDIPSTVNINLDSDDGSVIHTSSLLDDLPGLIGQLYEETLHPRNSDVLNEIGALEKILAVNAPERAGNTSYVAFDPSIYSNQFDNHVTRISDAIQKDINENKVFIADLSDLSDGKKKPQDIAWLQNLNPNISHLAAAPGIGTESALIKTVVSLKNSSKPALVSPVSSLISQTSLPLASQRLPDTDTTNVGNISPVTTTKTIQKNSTQSKTSKGIYVTKNGVSSRLNYFYEGQEDESILHIMDDDGDGDSEIFYTIGKTIYRKENHTKKPQNVYIRDIPQIYSTTSMMREFFGSDTLDVTRVPHDMQIFLRDHHAFSNIEATYLIHKKTDHQNFDIFSTWGESDSIKAQYRVDSILVPENVSTNGYTILPQPVLSDISGYVVLHRKKIYRILLPSEKYIDYETRKLAHLPSDFVIRAKKNVYTKDGAKIEMKFGNIKQDITLRPGQVLYFAQDSNILVKSGSLILPSDEYEDSTLDPSDIDTPLFLDDIIKPTTNGTASIEFADGAETDVYSNQTWSLVYHTGVQNNIQDFVLPVTPGWYYVVARDAFSAREKDRPRAILFDTYTDVEEEHLVDTVPTVINLNFDTPTEIDFQKYFPLDTIEKVAITGLSDAFWKQSTATKFLFQTSQEDRSMTLKVTSKKGVTYTYAIKLITSPATLAIKQVDSKKTLTGTVSVNTTLPLTIQSFIDNKSWTLSSPLTIQDKNFTTSFSDVSPEWSVSYGNTKAFSLKRDLGVLRAEAGLSLVPDIKVGSPIAVKTLLNQKEISRIVYQAHNLLFQQVISGEVPLKNTLGLTSTSLHLEPALSTDTALKGGAYIVDGQYRPILAFDAAGVVRFIGADVRFTSQYEGNSLILTLSRGRDELGKLLLSGDVLTVWEK